MAFVSMGCCGHLESECLSCEAVETSQEIENRKAEGS